MTMMTISLFANVTPGTSVTPAGTNINQTFFGTNAFDKPLIAKADVWDSSNVKFWGAKGDNATDDTAAIQSAISHNPTHVYFPPGNYRIYKTLYLPYARYALEGAVPVIDYGGETYSETILRFPTNLGTAIDCSTNFLPTIRNLYLSGESVCTNGITFGGMCNIDSVTCSDFLGAGFNANATVNSSVLSKCSGARNGIGLRMSGNSTVLRVHDSTFRLNRIGIELDNGMPNVEDCVIESNTSYGVAIIASNNIPFQPMLATFSRIWFEGTPTNIVAPQVSGGGFSSAITFRECLIGGRIDLNNVSDWTFDSCWIGVEASGLNTATNTTFKDCKYTAIGSLLDNFSMGGGYGTLLDGTSNGKRVISQDMLVSGISIGVGPGSSDGNTVVGGGLALSNNVNGHYNTALGYGVLSSNLTGNFNTGAGADSLNYNTNGIFNTANGTLSLVLNADGSYNTAMGGNVLFDNKSGSNNSAFGYNTGRGIVSGSYNTIIGANVSGLDAALSGNIIIADGQGNQRINVNENGNVNIGTGTNSITWSGYGDNSYGALTIGNRQNSGSLWVNVPVDPGEQQYSGGFGVDGTVGGTLNLVSTVNLGAYGLKFSGYSSALSFLTTEGTSVVERMRINNDGNVGINTGTNLVTWSNDSDSSFGALTVGKKSTGGSLWVNTPTDPGSPAFSGGFGVDGTVGGALNIISTIHLGAYGLKFSGYSSALSFLTTEGTSVVERMRINNDGNVGIGTNAPGYKLDVMGDAHAQHYYGNGGIFIQNASAPTAAIIGGTVGSVTNYMIINLKGALMKYWSDGSSLYSQEIGTH